MYSISVSNLARDIFRFVEHYIDSRSSRVSLTLESNQEVLQHHLSSMVSVSWKTHRDRTECFFLLDR